VPRRLVVNLSSVATTGTGLATVARQLVPELDHFSPLVLVRASQASEWAAAMPKSEIELIPDGLSSDAGWTGHARRLVWIELQASTIVRKVNGLLFSPVPEAPIFRNVPSLVMLHDIIPLLYFRRVHPLHLYMKHYVPRVLKEALLVICDSSSGAADAQRIADLSPRKIATIPLGVNQDIFTPLSTPEQSTLGDTRTTKTLMQR
jgi:hypothetical protein